MPILIEYEQGDILTADVEALVNSVNCVGVMGRGIALQFKRAFPANFKAYVTACKRGEVHPGQMFVFDTGQLTNPRYIINFPTKRHWRAKSRIEDIEAGLRALTETIRKNDLRSIAVPPLGSGLGGLDWAEVRPRIEAALRSVSDLRTVIYEPSPESAPTKGTPETGAPPMTAGRAALVELVSRYRRGLLDPFVTLLEVHKLMYFMQEAGEPLNLRFEKATYGPYAQNLRHVLRAIEGHFISGYADGGDAPGKQLTLLPHATEDAQAALRQHPPTQARLGKVAELVEGFESPFGLELLSSVHWLIHHEYVHEVDDLVRHMYSWNRHKRQFTPRQIGLALETLQHHDWSPGSATPAR